MVLGPQACGRHSQNPSTVGVCRGGKGDPGGTLSRLHSISHLNKSLVIGGTVPILQPENEELTPFVPLELRDQWGACRPG